MVDKSSHDPSILPLLAFLLSAAVLVFTACGTLEVGFVSRTVVPTVGASAVEQVPFSASETPTPTPYDYMLPAPTPAVEGVPITAEAWTTYTNSAPTETPVLITPTPTAPTPTPAETLTPSDSAPTVTPVVENPLPSAFCRPDEAAMTLSATATTLGVGQVVTVKITLVNGETSNVRLGQPQYMLYVYPDVFSLDGMKPVEKPVTIEPGQSDEIEFVLQATMPGRATLMGSVTYEMHDLKYSWGSWSGCRTEPLEITVTQ